MNKAWLSLFSAPGDSKDGEDFFPLAKKSDRKKRQYRGTGGDSSMSEKRERTDRDRHRKDRSDRDRRDRDLPSSRGSGESDGRERSGRSSNRRSPYSRSHRDRDRRHDKDRHERDNDGYRRDDQGWSGEREGRRGGLDRDRLRPNREDQYSGGRSRHSPYMEGSVQHYSRRQWREGKRDRDRDQRNNSDNLERQQRDRVYHDRGREWRSRPLSNHSPVERQKNLTGSESSEESGEEEDRSESRRRVELRPESIENLIRDLEERKRFDGDSGSDVTSASSPHSDRMVSDNHSL